MPNIKVEQICDIQMEHSHPIINLNVPQKKAHFDWVVYDNNFGFIKILSKLSKKFKFIDMFLDIERTRFQIINHMKYISIKKPHESFINIKIQLSYVGCTSQNMKQLIHVKHHVQSNNVKQHVKMNEHAHNSTYNDIYNK